MSIVDELREQRQNKGWLNKKALEKVAETLSMSFIRVLEVATFYSMFNLEPVGENYIGTLIQPYIL